MKGKNDQYPNGFVKIFVDESNLNLVSMGRKPRQYSFTQTSVCPIEVLIPTSKLNEWGVNINEDQSSNRKLLFD